MQPQTSQAQAYARQPGTTGYGTQTAGQQTTQETLQADSQSAQTSQTGTQYLPEPPYQHPGLQYQTGQPHYWLPHPPDQPGTQTDSGTQQASSASAQQPPFEQTQQPSGTGGTQYASRGAGSTQPPQYGEYRPIPPGGPSDSGKVDLPKSQQGGHQPTGTWQYVRSGDAGDAGGGTGGGGRVPPPPDDWNEPRPGGIKGAAEPLLKIFVLLCAVAYAISALRHVFELVADILFNGFNMLTTPFLPMWFKAFTLVFTVLADIIFVVSAVLLVAIACVITLRHREENAEGLAVLFCGTVGFRFLLLTAVNILSKLVLRYPLWHWGYIAKVGLVAGGVMIAYAVISLLGGSPLDEKSQEGLRASIHTAVQDALGLVKGRSAATAGGASAGSYGSSAAADMSGTAPLYNDQSSQGGAGGAYNPGVNCPPPAPARGASLRTNRSLLKYVVFTILTCGIYSFVFLYGLIRDINIVCDGDGSRTPGLLKYIGLSLLTCGIYSFFWFYQLGDRLWVNGARYGIDVRSTGLKLLLWETLGSFVIIGPFVAMNMVIRDTNMLCAKYNELAAGY